MKNSELLLFFFIIYDLIITMVFLNVYYDLKDTIDKKDEYIDELFNLANLKRK